ncbi:SusC/RagA family TonB-linked outer membrane protein [Chryseobacterium populi]|uniref:TonB-linked outer membrane protein, SusC/RagA family n=1 Tax=Chryseobacterium populi TaxID=1144316 RepID=J2K097_9FLAO|nr:SusC/RagA family TonB-linked outer membrane protein [Chryseobacterium populi]EJL73545.1 TonB-linked outer membrane protein, SusC/RagA family [Chryseobacterium populi]
MNVKLRLITTGVLFFTGQALIAQTVNKDTIPKEKQIEEVIVTGYQKKSKDEIAQAQSVVTAEELKTQIPTTSVGNMLQGRASGVFSQSRNGQPGSTAEINIRGISGLIGNSEPLYIVDGIYMTSRQFNAVNPNDIESVVILKDAAGTSQYGSRGANGVVVITTKKGRNGKTQYSFESRLGFSKKISDKELNFEMMNSTQKLQYEKEMRNLGLSGLPSYTAADEEALKKLDHDWQKDILRTSSLQSYIFSARGGSDKNKFYYSLGYDKDEGIVRDINGFDRYTGRFNFENNLSDKLKVGLDLGISYQYTENVRDRNNVQSPFGAMYRYNPFEPVYNSDGSYNFNLRQGLNIIEALRNNLDSEQRLRATGNIFGEYKINDALSYRMYFNTLYDNLVNTNNLKRGSQLDIIINGAAGLGSLRKTTFYSFNYIYGNRIDFKKQFNDHYVGATALVEFNNEFTENIIASGTNYKNPNSDAPSNTIPSDKNTFTGDKVRSTLFSLLGLAEYNYKKKYILTASIRQDKSSKFGENNKSGIFWSGSVAWNIGKEDFLNGGFLNDLKLRASYGTTGNDRNIPNFANVGYVAYGDYGSGANMTPTIITGNPDIKWETNKTTNLGVDFAFFKSRFRGAIEVYRSDRNDFIQLLPLPYESGNYAIYKNLGDMRTEGLETEFTFDIIRKENLKLSLRGNGSLPRAKILSLDGVSTQRNLGETALKVGETPYFYRLVEYAGVNAADGKALYYTDRQNPNAGENFYTVNGRTATDTYNATADIKDITDKSPLPKFFGGFGLSLEAYGFDLSADFTFKTGGYTYNYQTQLLQSSASRANNMSLDAFNYWKNPGDTDVLPKPTAVGLRASDQFLEKSDYLRFRTLMIGYTFNKKVLGEDVPLNSIRMYVQAQNLLTWTSFKGDPEVAVGSGENQLLAGQTFVSGSFALFSYPAVRQFMFGVQVEF